MAVTKKWFFWGNLRKTSCKRIHNPRLIKNICNSWKEVKISTQTEVWEKDSVDFMKAFEGFSISMEEVTAGAVATKRLKIRKGE